MNAWPVLLGTTRGDVPSAGSDLYRGAERLAAQRRAQRSGAERVRCSRGFGARLLDELEATSGTISLGG